MKILGLGVPELVIILVVVLLIFGPKNLPKLGSAIGKGVKGLRDGMGLDKKEAEEAPEEEAQAVVEKIEAPAEEAEGDAPVRKVKRVVRTTSPAGDSSAE